MKIPRSAYLFLFFVALIGACSVVKKESSEKDVHVYLTTFQSSLASSDEEILRQFESRQSREAILSAVKILQNKEHEFIECHAAFDNAIITKVDNGVEVVVPVEFKVKDIEYPYEGKTTSVVMLLKSKNDSFVITQLQAEEFYKAFADIRNTIEWSVERKLELREREPIYAQAKVLQTNFDSIVWFTQYKEQRYFYAVNGNWIGYGNRWEKREGDPNCKMGLIDDEGNIIIPVEYELIGTLGFHFPDKVEVKRDGKVGYFDIAAKTLIIPTSYDMIIPYEKNNAFAIVKQDKTYGWLDAAYQYNAGFPSPEAETWVKNFGFLPKDLTLKGDSVLAFAEIPNVDNAGSGIVAPPSYLVKTGIFNEVVSGISTTAVPINGWTEYVKTDGTILETITDKIDAVLTTITERYIDGREEFYTYNKLTFVNAQRDTLAVSDISTSGKIAFRQVDSTLLELKFESYSYEGSEFLEYNLPEFAYFGLNPDLSVVKRTSRREFAFTEFVKMDSSYLTGEFKTWDTETGDQSESNFLSLATLNYIRNEILADYGYRFTDEAGQAQFQYDDWYVARYDKIEDFHDEMSDIDRHNLAFLDRMIARMTDKPV